MSEIRIKAEFLAWNPTFLLPLFFPQNINNMNKGTHFIGQPMYGQQISLLDKSKILKISREKGGERYVKHFDAWQHLVIMLYAVIKRFDSLREITVSMFPEARKFSHLGIIMMPRRSTLSDAYAIKIQIWMTLIANLLLMVIQKRIKRTWSSSGLATLFRIMFMYYVNCYTFFEEPEKDWLAILEKEESIPPERSLFD